MTIDKDSLYDQIRLAVDIEDVSDDRIRYTVLGEEFDTDLNHIIYTYNLESKIPLDMLSVIFMETYKITVIVISQSETKITQLQDEIRSQFQTYFVNFNMTSVGDSEVLKDEELGVYSSSLQLEVIFN